MPIILLGFDDFFVQFHSVFFDGDSWRFSTTDTLLRLYPEEFWQDTSQLAAGIVVAQAVVVADRGDLVAAPSSPGAEPSVIDVRREGLPYLRIGHRGAATLAPENTLDSFRAAIAVGVDLIEFDVLDLKSGPLVLAHSDHLDEVSHGAASGRVRSKSLEELREVAPNLPTFDEALAFFVDEAPEIGLHVDLKLTTRLDEVAEALTRSRARGQNRDQWLSRSEPARSGARSAARARSASRIPEDRLSISRKPYLWPIVSLGLTSMRASVGLRLPRLARRVGATAVMLSTASSRSHRWRNATRRDCLS